MWQKKALADVYFFCGTAASLDSFIRGPITGWAKGPSQRKDLCLGMTQGVLKQESAAAAEPPLSSCNSSASGLGIRLYSSNGINRVGYSHCNEELVRKQEWKQMSYMVWFHNPCSGHYLSVSVSLSVWGAALGSTHLFFFSQGNESSSFIWLIVSIRSFSSPSACGCKRFSPNTACLWGFFFPY